MPNHTRVEACHFRGSAFANCRENVGNNIRKLADLEPCVGETRDMPRTVIVRACEHNLFPCCTRLLTRLVTADSSSYSRKNGNEMEKGDSVGGQKRGNNAKGSFSEGNIDWDIFALLQIIETRQEKCKLRVLME